MNQNGQKPAPVKLYLRIGEVAELVGVQPHVLRYWESEFRGTIRPQKSKKGQRVYSRADVDRLIKVKDLLRNQGFTIAGARKVLRESGPSRAVPAPEREQATALAPSALSMPMLASATQPVALPSNAATEHSASKSESSVVRPLFFSTITEARSLMAAGSEAKDAQLAAAPLAEARPEFEIGLPAAGGIHADRSAKRLRRALVELRQEVVSALSALPNTTR